MRNHFILFYFLVGREKVSLLPELQKRKDLMFLNSLNLNSLNRQNLIQMCFVKLLMSAGWPLSHVDRNPWDHQVHGGRQKINLWKKCGETAGELEEAAGILVAWFQIWFYHLLSLNDRE